MHNWVYNLVVSNCIVWQLAGDFHIITVKDVTFIFLLNQIVRGGHLFHCELLYKGSYQVFKASFTMFGNKITHYFINFILFMLFENICLTLNILLSFHKSLDHIVLWFCCWSVYLNDIEINWLISVLIEPFYQSMGRNWW